LASLNALAPGRIDFGISTGFTATRTMGLGPVSLADLEQYIRVVEDLLAGDITEWDFAGRRRKIRFLNPEVGAINITDPIPLYVAAAGPRGRALTAAVGANWMQVAGNQAAALAGLAAMRKAWGNAGIDPASKVSAALASGSVLRAGEAYDSPRARAQAGPHATIMLHFLAEMGNPEQAVGSVPPSLAPLVERYLEIYEGYEPADARYLENHRGHLMFLRPEQQELCTAELIQAGTFTGEPAELRDRLRELRDAGHDHFAIRIAHGQPEMLEEWADVFEQV
jgi:5,10-methylenetetrahydromethanopterin reductase